MSVETLPAVHGYAIDQAAVLRTLNLDASQPQTQALLLVCERYGLDPLLKHMVLIQGRPYVTRDGYLHVAHLSGALDGIVIEDEGEEGAYWWARVSVYRKDMTRPFTYKGRYPKSGSNKTYGPEMAIKCAEVAALRRAFNVTGIAAADEKWDADDEHTADPAPEHDSTAAEVHQANVELRARVDALGEAERAAFVAWKADQGFAFTPGVGYAEDDLAAMGAHLDTVEDVLPPSDAEAAIAAAPCEICGSTRAKRVLNASRVSVCADAKGCEERAAKRDLENPCSFEDCPEPAVEAGMCAQHAPF